MFAAKYFDAFLKVMPYSVAVVDFQEPTPPPVG
jgi:hypothetical protein